MPEQSDVQEFAMPYCELIDSLAFLWNRLYEGHLINKLLNGIILSIFRIWKIRDIRFVENLFMNTSCEFHQGDVITMMSPEFWTQSVSTVFYPAVFLHNSPASIRENQLQQSLRRSSLVKTARRPGHFFSTTLSRLWANFSHETLYCRLSKIIFIIYWMQFWVNCVGTKLFSPEKTNDRTPFLAGCFQR